jgi:pseudouridine-5'-phosphate glycosidase
VPVVTYGRTNDFPAFYNPKSGFKVDTHSIIFHPVDPIFSYVSESLES